MQNRKEKRKNERAAKRERAKKANERKRIKGTAAAQKVKNLKLQLKRARGIAPEMFEQELREVTVLYFSAAFAVLRQKFGFTDGQLNQFRRMVDAVMDGVTEKMHELQGEEGGMCDPKSISSQTIPDNDSDSIAADEQQG